MTALMERAARPKHPVAAELNGGLPQVNLLPPAVRAGRALSRTKRLLAYVLVAVVLLIGVGVVGAIQVLGSENHRRDQAQAESVRLTQAQAQYAEAPRVLGQVSALESARQQGFATDVTWTPYLNAIYSVLPEGTQLITVGFTGLTPSLVAPLPTDPLQAPSVTQISFTGQSATLIDTAGWIDALNGVPGFADAWVSSATRGESEDGTIYYSVTSTVQVTAGAFSGRYDTEGN